VNGTRFALVAAASLAAALVATALPPGDRLGATTHAATPRLPGETPLPAELSARIEQGEGAFRVQNYGRVVEILDRLAGHPRLEGRPEHVRVLEMLAASHWFTTAKDSARLVFGQLLRESPFHRLDEFVYPPELVDFFETRRRELVTAGIIPASPNDVSAPRRVLVRELKTDDTPAIVFLAPFGVGQFVNDEDGKGTAMAIIQGLGAATMVACYVGIETLKVPNTNRIRVEDGGQARLLNSLWYGGLIVFSASWAYSIVDGFAYRRTEPIVEERFENIEPRGPETTLRFVPGPGDLGLGVALDF
jgi:hypothetical protein